jgi:outer membrane lipase/esterase
MRITYCRQTDNLFHLAKQKINQMTMGEDTMTKIKSIAAAVALTGSAAAWADGFSNVYFFGDSLTDSGYFKNSSTVQTLAPGGGKFTTNPGTVWAENLATAFGFNGAPNNAGGTDYAQGGARVAQSPGIGSTPPPIGASPVSAQVTSYLTGTGGHADPSALYAVWAGANDVFAATNAYYVGATPPGYITALIDPTTYIPAAAGAEVQQIAGLQALGARYILVPNLPDMGKTPAAVAADLALGDHTSSTGLTQLSSGYNTVLFAGLRQAGIHIIPADVAGLFNEMLESPSVYGFTHTNDAAACTTNLFDTLGSSLTSLLCVPGSSGAINTYAANADKTYVFADGGHPTTAAHKIISDYIFGILTAPRAISLLAETPVQVRTALFDTLNGQLAGESWTTPQGGNNLWVKLGSGEIKFDSTSQIPGAKGTPNDITVGFDKRISATSVIGAAASFSTIKPDFGLIAGHYKEDEQALAIYYGYRHGAYHATVVGAFSTINYDTTRNLALGPATRVINGSTSGSNVSIGGTSGWDFSAGNITHGPFVSLNVQRVTVSNFVETGGGAAGMTFYEQRRDSQLGSLGYKVAADLGQYRPYASITIDNEFKNTDRVVTADLNTLAVGGFDLPASTPGRHYGTFAAGVSAKFTPTTTGTLAFNSRFSQDNVKAYGIMAAVNFGF